MDRDKYVLFWGGPFSQWLSCEFEISGVMYNCAEQYMMAMKANHFDDMNALGKIMRSNSPSDQKKIGRKIKNFDEVSWALVARNYVYEGNYAKFTQNPKLLEGLMSTKSKIIVEASPYDKIWGIGMGINDPRCYDMQQWQGLNWLGQVLTDLREDLSND